MKKCIISIIVILVVTFLAIVGWYISFKDKPTSNVVNDIDNRDDIIEEILLDDAINDGCFVITNGKIYNKDILERFINNTEINATNRIEDKIRIVEYNYDGYPTIYDLEYKIFDETYINAEQQKVNKSGYILTTDARRNNLIPRDIETNYDIPGEYYTITIREDEGIDAAIISLSLYAEINFTKTDKEPYEDIEIARYLLDDDVIDKNIKQDSTDSTVKLGIVELNHNGYIYMFGGQHFGELGYEIEEYTSSNIDNNNQTCIDYLTLKKYDTRYIEEGDLVICTGSFTQTSPYYDGDFDTKNNPIIVLKSKDYDKMKQAAIKEERKSTITIGDIYDELGYLYLKYDFEDTSHSGETYHLPFIQKVYVTKDTKVTGELKKGKTVKVEYTDSTSKVDGLDLKVIRVIN